MEGADVAAISNSRRNQQPLSKSPVRRSVRGLTVCRIVSNMDVAPEADRDLFTAVLPSVKPATLRPRQRFQYGLYPASRMHRRERRRKEVAS